jgi:hypothetical protein
MSVKPLFVLLKNNMWAVLTFLLGVLWTLTISFAESWGNERWQKKTEATAFMEEMAPIPPKVQRLEEHQIDQKTAQVTATQQLTTLKDSLTEIKVNQASTNALMSELIKSNDRVLRRLDDQSK